MPQTRRCTLFSPHPCNAPYSHQCLWSYGLYDVWGKKSDFTTWTRAKIIRMKSTKFSIWTYNIIGRDQWSEIHIHIWMCRRKVRSHLRHRVWREECIQWNETKLHAHWEDTKTRICSHFKVASTSQMHSLDVTLFQPEKWGHITKRFNKEINEIIRGYIYFERNQVSSC